MKRVQQTPDILRGSDEICAYLRITVWTLKRWRQQGLPIRYCGGLTAIRCDVDDWLRSRPAHR